MVRKLSNKLKFIGHYIEIHCSRTDTETQFTASQIPYIHRNRTNTLYTTSIRNIDLVLKLFRNIDATDIDKLPATIRKLYDEEMHRRITTKSLIELGPDEPVEKTFLWRHQELGRQLAVVNKRYGFYYDTRTGKTPMSLQVIWDDVRKNPTHKWLVLCPLILIDNAWLEDAVKMFPQMSVVSLHDTSKDKRLAKYKQKANLYISNIESFTTYRSEIEKLGIHGVFVDESSAMKSTSSKFGKEAVDYAYTVKRWYLLSGTPAPNGEWEYYRQLQSIDFFGVHSSWSQFKEYFFVNTSRNPQYEKLQIRHDREAELLTLLKSYSLYVDKEDVLTTPGREFREVELTMPDELKQKYQQLKQDLYLELGENVSITSPGAAANLNKLNQVTSGFVIDTLAIKTNRAIRDNYEHGGQMAFDEFKEEVHMLSEYRFDALDKLLSELGDKQAIIWCNYRKEFEIIQQRLGDKCVMVYGGVDITTKNTNIKLFKTGAVQYLVANPASADKGLTLTNAHICIYFSLGYSYELWKQSIERIYGDIIKQPNFCTYYIFIAKATVDRTIYTTVQNKGDMSMAVLEHLKGGM